MDQNPTPPAAPPSTASDTDPADPFAFDPVPRRRNRVDGWTPERQRAFIEAVRVTGSKRRAAHAVGKADFGVDQLLKAPGSESFARAYAAARAEYRDKDNARIEAGIDIAAQEDAAWAPARGPWQGSARRAGARAPVPVPWGVAKTAEDDADLEKLARLIGASYMTKIVKESEARAAGRIAEADLYLRQITHIEVILEAVAAGKPIIPLLESLRIGERPALSVAQTDATRLLDQMRREAWAAMDAPPRPETVEEEWLVDKDGVFIEPQESTLGGSPLSHEEQRALFRERYAEAARKQVEWEAEARRDYEARGAAEPRAEGTYRAASGDFGEERR